MIRNQISLWQRLAASVPHARELCVPGQQLAISRDPIASVVFPVSAVFAQIRHEAYDSQPLASGLIGFEGMVGWSRFLGNPVWQHGVLTVVGGDAIRVDAAALETVIERAPALRATILRYIHNYTMQLTQNAIANLGHSLDRRLARLLSMVHDRSAGDKFAVTHDLLAMLLNVRRASITDTLHILEGDRLIQSTRGLIVVRDRVGLERRAGHSYGYAENDYQAEIGAFGKSAVAS